MNIKTRDTTYTYVGDPFFAHMGEASTVMIWIVDAEGRIVHSNLSARRSLLPGNLDVGAQWRAIWPKTSQLYINRALDDALTGQAAAFRIRCPLTDGANAYLDINIGPIRDHEGRLIRLLIRAEDVTAQVESAAFLHTVIDTLPSALTVRDARTGRYILANRAAEALFDRPGGLIGHTGEDVLPPAFAAWEAEETSLRGPARSTFETDAAAGGDRLLAAVKVATYDDDGVRHVISLTEDVTQQRRDEVVLRDALEQARQAERVRSTFLSNISHELRTPLNGVVAGVDLIESGSGDPAEVFEMVRRSAATLERRLEDLMRVVQIDSHDEDGVEPIEVDDVLQGLAARFRARADAKGLRLAIETTSLPPSTGHRICLEEALSRLIDNAIKFSDRGRILLRAEALPDNWVRFSVIDDGPGFDPDTKDQLFNGFQKGDDSLTRSFGGLGLGLTIARKAVKKLGGVIDAAPRPEGGARFWLDVPLTPTSPQMIEADIDADRRLRILIADDHPTNRRIVELMLENLAEVTSVEDGLKAVAATANEPFDVILMDIQMPRLDGISAVARIRAAETESGRAPTPVIMLTANTQSEHLEASRAVGADRHIGKPFTAAVLLNGIQSVLGERLEAHLT